MILSVLGPGMGSVNGIASSRLEKQYPVSIHSGNTMSRALSFTITRIISKHLSRLPFLSAMISLKENREGWDGLQCGLCSGTLREYVLDSMEHGGFLQRCQFMLVSGRQKIKVLLYGHGKDSMKWTARILGIWIAVSSMFMGHGLTQPPTPKSAAADDDSANRNRRDSVEPRNSQ